MIEEYKGQPVPIKNPIGSATGAARYRQIQDLVSRWAKRNQDQVLLYNEYAQELRDNLKDKEYGDISGKKFGTGTRIGVIIHPHLMNYIQAFYSDFMDTSEDVAWFKKTYPNWRIPQK